MFSFRQKDEDVVYGILFDIASGSVGVAIVVSNKNERFPKILYQHRVLMRVTEHIRNTEEHLRRIREALFSAALTASQHGGEALRELHSNAHITKVYVTCGSPWSYTIARNVHYENDHSFKINQSLLHDLVLSAEEEIVTKLRETALLKDEQFEVVERATVDISVNEYPVTNPLSLEGTILDLSHVVGAIPRDVLTAIHDVQDKLFPNTELKAHTYMLIMYCILRDILPKLHSICIIDITSEATEFGIVEHNLLTENLSIRYGSASFIRNIATATGKPIADIQTSIEQGLISDDRAAYDAEIEVYTEHIQKAIDDLTSRRIIPSDIVVTADSTYNGFFKDIIEQAITKANIGTIRVIPLESRVISEISTKDADVYLVLGARFFHKLHGCGEMNDV